jgi:iron complex transport system substrate-binding protein
MMNRSLSALSLVAAIVLAPSVVAAGTNPPLDDGDTVVVVDGTGTEVEVPANPQRVFGMYTTDLDYALALGLSVAPTQAIRTGSVGLPEFFEYEEVADLEFFVNYPEYNWEAIAAAEPDLILNGLGFEGGPDTDLLDDIAPTYTFDGFGGDWREDFTAIAEAFGRQPEAEAMLAEIAARTDELRPLVEAHDEPLVMAYGYYEPDGSGGFYGPQRDQLQPVVFHDLGIETTAAATEPWSVVAQEQMGLLADCDIILLAVETSERSDVLLDAVRADPIWSALPAVAEGRVFTVNNELSYSSPSAHLEFLDVLEDALRQL